MVTEGTAWAGPELGPGGSRVLGTPLLFTSSSLWAAFPSFTLEQLPGSLLGAG